MPRVVFRLYAQLNDGQPAERRQTPFTLDLPDGARLGEALRGLEVSPETVGFVLVNGERAAFDRPLAEGDRVAAYPPLSQLQNGSSS